MRREKRETHKWNVADTITAVRMIAALFLLFLPLRSAGFLILYSIAGLTDALDGYLARRMGRSSDFGARLDSIADLLFYAVLLLRLFPVLWRALPVAVWIVVALVLLVRLCAYCVAAAKYHRFASLHTWLNKMTGIGVFLLPYILAASSGVSYSWALCALALAASLEELVIHLCRERYCADIRTIFQRTDV